MSAGAAVAVMITKQESIIEVKSDQIDIARSGTVKIYSNGLPITMGCTAIRGKAISKP